MIEERCRHGRLPIDPCVFCQKDWQDQDVSRSRPITTAEAAAIASMTIAAFRKAMQRLRLQERNPIDLRLPETEWFPGSNPAWNESEVRKWAAGRLGRAEQKDTDHG